MEEPWMTSYAPLRRQGIRQRIKQLQTIVDDVDRAWKSEVSVYERGGSDGGDDDDKNHTNDSMRIHHSNLFPYHDALYPLLDVYYHLLTDDPRFLRLTSSPRQCQEDCLPSPVYELRERRHLQVSEVDIPDYFPNSAYSVYISLLPSYRRRACPPPWEKLEESSSDTSDNDPGHNFFERERAGNFEFMVDWESAMWNEDEFICDKRNDTWKGAARQFYEWRADDTTTSATSTSSPKHKFGPDRMPKDAKSRARICTKVLRHAISDLHKDHRLGQAAMLLMSDFAVFDDDNHDIDNYVEGRTTDVTGGVDRLARVLAVIAEDYVPQCDWDCHQRYLDALDAAGLVHGHFDTEEHDITPPNHYCTDWKNLIRSCSTLISNGITFVTEGHAELVAAFVLNEFNQISSAAAAIDAQYFEGDIEGDEDGANATSSSSHNAALLKQNLFFHNNTSGIGAAAMNDGDNDGGHDVDESFRLSLVYALVDGLGWHAAKDWKRLKKLVVMLESGQFEDRELSIVAKRTMSSYYSCIKALVSIGEHTIRRMPPNTRTTQLGAAVVRGLVLGSVDHDATTLAGTGYVGPSITNIEGKSLISPTRLSDAIANATENVRQMPGTESTISSNAPLKEIVQHVFDSAPHEDVTDVVRGLFLRDLVDTSVCGFGYSDYLVWCRLPITPYDPLLFDHNFQFPDNLPPGNEWVRDEDGKLLEDGEIAARFDFSLLMLQRAWRAPWTPKSHRSFTKSHRDAIKTLLLCSLRYGMSNDIALNVIAFFPRTWWADDRRRCWCHDCELARLATLIKNKSKAREVIGANDRPGGTSASSTLPTPPLPQSVLDGQGQVPATMHNVSLLRPVSAAKQPKDSSRLFECNCKVALYCSKEHRKYLLQDGHKSQCGKPPFRVAGIEEELLVREVFPSTENKNGKDQHSEEESDGEEIVDGSDDDDDDDESCWESVDSDEEDDVGEEATKKTRTEIIFNFFNRKSYRLNENDHLHPALAGHGN